MLSSPGQLAAFVAYNPYNSLWPLQISTGIIREKFMNDDFSIEIQQWPGAAFKIALAVR